VVQAAVLLIFLSAEGCGSLAEGLRFDCGQYGSFTVLTVPRSSRRGCRKEIFIRHDVGPSASPCAKVIVTDRRWRHGVLFVINSERLMLCRFCRRWSCLCCTRFATSTTRPGECSTEPRSDRKPFCRSTSPWLWTPFRSRWAALDQFSAVCFSVLDDNGLIFIIIVVVVCVTVFFRLRRYFVCYHLLMNMLNPLQSLTM